MPITLDKKNLLTILLHADMAAKAAFDKYSEEHYKQPNYVVRQHANQLDDNSPVVKEYPIADLCGFVTMLLSQKNGRNREFINAFKKCGEFKSRYDFSGGKDGYHALGNFRLDHSDYDYGGGHKWLLDAPNVGYGNCCYGAMQAAGRAFKDQLALHDIIIRIDSRLD